MKCDIKSKLPSELEERFEAIGEKKYRAAQVFSWLYKGVKAFDEMTDLSLDLRSKLCDEFFISSLTLADKQVSSDGTVKYLWGAGDDFIESVLMEYKHGFTVCISSQVGCKMGCLFCASGIGGLKRSLTPAEMLDQVLYSSLDSGIRISNVVLMGIGEPLDNFDNVMKFITLINSHKGMNIGARHITLSTCGIAEYIDRLADYSVQLSLAISLHAPDDETRSMLMPSNRSTSIKALIEASERYAKSSGRRVTYEYILIDGVNDSSSQAEKLSQLLRNSGSHLNLIHLNSIPESDFQPSKKENADNFTQILQKNGVSFTTRRSLGSDIDAACGQLRRKRLDGVMGHN